MYILYFSRTGHARQVAERIAAKLNIQAHPLCGSEWSGWRGLVRYAAYRLRGGQPPVSIRLPDALQGTMILIAPIWDGHLVPPAQEALKKIDRAKTLLITVSKRSKLRDNLGCIKVYSLCEGEDPEEVIKEVIGYLESGMTVSE